MRWAIAGALLLAACGTSGGEATVDAGAKDVLNDGPDAGGADGGGVDGAAGKDAAGPDSGPGADVLGTDSASSDGGGSDDGGHIQDPDGGGAPTAGSFCTAYGAAWCGLLDRCPPPWRAAWTGGCVDAMTAGCQPAWLDAATTSGDVTFDGAAAASCLGSLDAMSCAEADALWLTQGDNVPAECKAVLSGTRGAGASCVVGPECSGDTVCVFGDACPGTCTAQSGAGASCAGGELCAWPDTLCLEGKCAALPATVGATCVSGLCHAPLVCEADACTAPSLAEQPCGNGAVCFPGLICFRPSDQQTGTCKLPRAVGESCFDSWQCDPTSAAGRLVCAGGACETAPGPGEPCWEYTCDHAACDTAQIPPTCVALPGAGSSCWQGGACAEGTFCDGGACKALGAPGDPCVGHYQCAALRCYGGVCVAPDEPPCPL